MARKGKDEFDWLDDPFDEKKAAREQAQAATSNGTKLALGCGCLVVIVALVAMALFFIVNMADVLA